MKQYLIKWHDGYNYRKLVVEAISIESALQAQGWRWNNNSDQVISVERIAEEMP